MSDGTNINTDENTLEMHKLHGGGTKMSITVPQGSVSGQQLQFKTPDGNYLTAAVPKGLKAGDTFIVDIPSSTPSQSFSVMVPQGMSAGQELSYKTPDGLFAKAVIPPGFKAGDSFLVEAPMIKSQKKKNERMRLTVPEGMKPGQELQFKTPNGKLMKAVIPQGINVGDTFEVEVSALDAMKQDDKDINFLSQDVKFPSDYEDQDQKFKLPNKFVLKFSKNYMVRDQSAYSAGNEVDIERLGSFNWMQNKNEFSLKNIYFYGRWGKHNQGGTLGIYDYMPELKQSLQTFLSFIIKKSLNWLIFKRMKINLPAAMEIGQKISEMQRTSNNVIDTIVITHCDIITVKNLLVAFNTHNVKMRVLNVRKVKYNINYRGSTLAKSREFYKLPELNKIQGIVPPQILKKIDEEKIAREVKEHDDDALNQEVPENESFTKVGEEKKAERKNILDNLRRKQEQYIGDMISFEIGLPLIRGGMKGGDGVYYRSSKSKLIDYLLLQKTPILENIIESLIGIVKTNTFNFIQLYLPTRFGKIKTETINMSNVHKTLSKEIKRDAKLKGGAWYERDRRQAVAHKYVDLEDPQNPFSKRFRKAVTDANFERYKQKLPPIKISYGKGFMMVSSKTKRTDKRIYKELAGHLWKDIYSRLVDIQTNVFNIRNKLKKEPLTEQEVDLIYSYLDSKYDEEVANKRGTALERKTGTKDGILTKLKIDIMKFNKIYRKGRGVDITGGGGGDNENKDEDENKGEGEEHVNDLDTLLEKAGDGKPPENIWEEADTLLKQGEDSSTGSDGKNGDGEDGKESSDSEDSGKEGQEGGYSFYRGSKNREKFRRANQRRNREQNKKNRQAFITGRLKGEIPEQLVIPKLTDASPPFSVRLRNLTYQVMNLVNMKEFKQQAIVFKGEKEVRKQMEDLENMESNLNDSYAATSRSYTYDAKTYIDLKINGSIFDSIDSKKDTIIVKYNDEWSLPSVRFEDSSIYRTGKKDFIMKFYFPTSVEKKEAYKKMLTSRDDPQFFEKGNIVKVNWTNKSKKTIGPGEELFMVHPIYLVPISVKNLYSDGIKPSETVRIYLRGKVFINDSTKSDNNKNFSVRGGGNQSKNIVQVSVKNMELTKFSISEIKENIQRCILLNETYYDLHDVYVLLTSMDKSFQLPGISLLDFYNHQQFIINIYGVKRRIFYKRKEELGNDVKPSSASKNNSSLSNSSSASSSAPASTYGSVQGGNYGTVQGGNYGNVYTGNSNTRNNKTGDAFTSYRRQQNIEAGLYGAAGVGIGMGVLKPRGHTYINNGNPHTRGIRERSVAMQNRHRMSRLARRNPKAYISSGVGESIGRLFRGGAVIDSSLDIDNTMIYVFNSQLVNRGRVRLNKKYGTIYVNFEETVSNKVKDAEIVELTEIDKKTLDFNKIYKLKYGGSTTEIYVLSVQTLQQLLENDSSVVIQEVPPTPLTKEQLLGKINLDDLELGELGELGDLINSSNNEQKSMETKKEGLVGSIKLLSALKMRISKLINHRDNQESIEQNIAMKKRGEKKEQEKQKQEKKNRLDNAAEIELRQKKMKLQMFYKGLKKYRKKDNVKPIFKEIEEKSKFLKNYLKRKKNREREPIAVLQEMKKFIKKVSTFCIDFDLDPNCARKKK